MRLYIYPTRSMFNDFKEMKTKKMLKYNLEWHTSEEDIFWIVDLKTLKELENFITDCPHDLIFKKENWDILSGEDKKIYSDCYMVELYNGYRE